MHACSSERSGKRLRPGRQASTLEKALKAEFIYISFFWGGGAFFTTEALEINNNVTRISTVYKTMMMMQSTPRPLVVLF